MLIFTSLLAFYLAWNLGANDVANSMGTSIGSKAVTLRQALVIAGILEFTGAVLFGQKVSETLATQVVNISQFAPEPQMLLLGMVAVLAACGVWLNLATFLGLPVSSSHAIVGAIAGFACVALSPQAVNWSAIGVISLTWIATPVVSGTIAALLYSLVQRFILQQPDPIAQLRQWIPWLSAALVGSFGVIVLPTLSQPIYAFLIDRLNLTLPPHDLSLALGTIAALSLTLLSWRRLEAGEGQGAEVLLRVELQFASFQLLSACFVAFAHGSNDVGNAVAPLATIAYIVRSGTVPLAGLTVPLWILVLGGVGIVAGLAVWGKKVIATIGEGIIALQPSGGFCAELATATTVLLASRAGLPVSTSHALVGGVVGIGLVQLRSLPLKTLGSIALAWVITIPVAAGLAALIFRSIQEFVTRSV
ncbi:MAG TPA: inorganic phosphate transporter [Thermosynechococcaceae cyanobacterium]